MNLTALLKSPLFEQLTEAELESFLHCRGGGFLTAEKEKALDIPESGTALYVVASGRGTLRTDSGNPPLHFWKVEEGVTFLPGPSCPGLVPDTELLLCRVDVGKALVACGESCPGHLKVSRKLFELFSRNQQMRLHSLDAHLYLLD